MSALAKIIDELKKNGSEAIKKVLLKHGAREPFFGVKIEYLKKIQKRVKKDHVLALELYDTGIGDAQYLAGLIADPPKMTKAQLQKWLKTASWGMVGEFTVPWVASESRFGAELARAWIDSKNEDVATSGWSTWSSLVSIKPDAELDLAELEELLNRVKEQIHTAPNRVRYVMNGFLIAAGSYVPALTVKAKAVGKAIGAVEVDLVGACKLPDAVTYIEKVEKAGRVGRKRATAMC